MLLMLSLAFLLEFSCSREKLCLLAAFPNQSRCDSFTLLPLTAQLLGLGRQWLGHPRVTFFQVLIHWWAPESPQPFISATERIKDTYGRGWRLSQILMLTLKPKALLSQTDPLELCSGGSRATSISEGANLFPFPPSTTPQGLGYRSAEHLPSLLASVGAAGS